MPPPFGTLLYCFLLNITAVSDMRNSLLVVCALLLAATATDAIAGKVYKWVDKDGNTHYTNTPPPEASQQERTVLDAHGNVTETLSAPKTAEEIEADRQQKAAAAEAERAAKELAAKDNMLLQTYSSAEEMELARDGRLAALEAQVKVVSGTISSLETQLAEQEKQLAVIRENGKPIPPHLQTAVEKTRKELLQNQKFLMAREEEQEQIRQKFATDIARFRELRGSK